MTAKTKTPDYELFTTQTRGNTWAMPFVKSLQPGEPQRVPIEESTATKGAPVHRYGQPVREAAKTRGFKVAIRTMFDGELWACRLRDEDVDGK